ncbi:GNAT family N-acetyltransferase [Streptomyces sp. NPDC005548]|uniref:GNAT family N-acetyltransferase n=1 Tax=Streptomyces sp. NPDC005548 TaxID=3364724 RepID=UPI0036A9CD5A
MRGVPRALPTGVRWEADGPLHRVVGHFCGFVIGPRDLGPVGPDLDRLITRQRDHFAARGEAVEWKIRGHDGPADLGDRLRAAGFVPGPTQTVLIGRAADLATEPRVPEGVALRRVAAEPDIRRIAKMEAAVWDMDWRPLHAFLTGQIAAAPDDMAVFVAEADGEVVSAAWLLLTPGGTFAGLRGGTTVPPWRGRGIYRALIAARARLALARGAEHLHVDASRDSAPTLQRLGFRPATTATPYMWTPAIRR